MGDVIQFRPSQAWLEETMRDWDFSEEDIRANRVHHGGKLYLSPEWIAVTRLEYWDGKDDKLILCDHITGELDVI